MQNAIGSADEHFRLLVESVQDYAIFMLDVHGNVASWNEGARRIKGYEASEILGRHFSRFYRPEDVVRGVCERELEAAARDGRCEDYGWRVRKDGSRFWANVVITPVKNREGELIGFAKVTRDMTARAYQTFIEATHAIVWTADAAGNPNADSPTWRAFTGQTEAEWRRGGLDAVHRDDRPAVDAAWAAGATDRRPFESELRLHRANGDYAWMALSAVPLFDGDGNVREWFVVMLDISRRKAAEIEREVALGREREARIEAEHVQAQLTTTLSSIGDAVLTTDAHGRVTFMNGIAEKLTRWSSEAARGRPLSDVFALVNEDTRRPVEHPVEKVLREGVIVGLANHTVLVRRDGTDVPIDDSAAPIRDSTGALFGVVMVFRDVTEEKREAARRAFLLRAGEALMSAPDYRDSLSTVAHLAVPRLADWCSVSIVEPGSSAPVQLAIAHVDPAKINMARELVRKYPAEADAAFGVPNVIRTGQSELYREVDPAMLEAGARDDEHRRLLRRLMLRSAIVVPLRGRERVFGALTFVYAESGREYTDADLVFAEELARRAGVVIERRKLEEERARLLESERRAREQAEIANRAKDDFLATVSHELRNPLSTILGWARMLGSDDLPEKFREPVRTIERNARSQQRLIDDMLDVSRIISGKLRLHLSPTDVVQTIADALESQRRAAESKGVRVESEIGPAPEVQLDPVRLQQIVSNLVANAVKFTPRGGVVRVTERCAGDKLEIRVRDTGEGIDPSRLTAIFEPFRQEDASTTRRHGGLGLGLAIVRELVGAHGGAVRAESEGKGKGATFVVELPARCERPSEPPSSRPERPRPPDLGGTSVLVVDNDDDLVALLRTLLEAAGARVEVARSGAEGVEQVRRQRPEVIVSDVGMPEMDGYEMMQRIRALPAADGGRTPAVALTAYARPDDARRAFAAGFQRHVAKPVDPDELVLAIANLAGLPLRPA